MAISAISSISANGNTFGNRKVNKDGYENPINRKTERNIAILGTVGTSALIGTTAGVLTSCISKGWKNPTFITLATTAISLALLLPSKLYNTKLNAFSREKEMDVFSRQKDAQANIYGAINEEIKNEEISLDDKINHYATTKIADNGRGLMVKEA